MKCHQDFAGVITEVVEKSITETLTWYANQTTLAESERSPFATRLQDVILSRMYQHHVSASGNFHWHIAVSEIHHESEEVMNCLLSNHYALVNDKKNVETEGIVKLNQSGVKLNYLCRASASFNVQTGGQPKEPHSKSTVAIKRKRLAVLIFNQNYYH